MATPGMIHRSGHRTGYHANFYGRANKEKGDITTPFALAVLNEMDCFYLNHDVNDHLPQLRVRAGELTPSFRNKLFVRWTYIRLHSRKMEEIRKLKWT